MKRYPAIAAIVCGLVWWSFPTIVAVALYSIRPTAFVDEFFSTRVGWMLFALFVLLVVVHAYFLWTISVRALREAQQGVLNVERTQWLILKLLGCAVAFGFPAAALMIFAPFLLILLRRG